MKIIKEKGKRKVHMKRIVSQKGITLIALIISIIILLMLAMISISLITNNSIIDKAKNSVEKYREQEELEKVQLAVTSALLKGNGALTEDNLNTEIQENFDNKTLTETSIGWILKLDKRYKIFKDGKVEVEEGVLLPSEYTQVEYIESTGTQYIDTNVIQNSHCSIFYDASIEEFVHDSGIVGAYSQGIQGFGICQFIWERNI